MESVIFVLMIMIWIIATTVLKRASKGNKPGASRQFGNKNGKAQDITCRRFGHEHPEWKESQTMHISHEDPEEGFIILNGKKMHRTEADAYENRI